MASEKYRDVINEFQKIGRMIWDKELNNSHSGNMSVRIGDRILITRRGSMLGFLKDSDIIETGLDRNDSLGSSCSISLEQELPKALKNYKIVMVRGHGAFAIGDFLEEALQYSHILESIARIVYMTKTLGGDLEKIQKGMYSTW